MEGEISHVHQIFLNSMLLLLNLLLKYNLLFIGMVKYNKN